MDIEYDLKNLCEYEEHRRRISNSLNRYESEYSHVDHNVRIKIIRAGFSPAFKVSIHIGPSYAAAKLRFELTLDVKDIHGVILGTIHSYLIGLDQ